MESNVILVVILAVLAVGALLAFGLATAWRRVTQDDAPLPMFDMLRRRGLAPEWIEAAAGTEAMAHAVRRCALCSAKQECRQRAATGIPAPADCPNSNLFAQVSARRA